MAARTKWDRLKGAFALLITPLLPLACATGGAQQAVVVPNDQTITCLITSEPPTEAPVEDDYDQPPRAIKITRPHYPQDAFQKKVVGIVVVEILIDSTGRVARGRVIQSVPMLNAAALQCVCQWVFEPPIKDGRPVATIAHAPVEFRIY